MTGAVLALDLGTKLGWAIRHADQRIESGARDFSPERHEGDGLRFLRFRAWLHDTKQRLEAAGERLELIRYERVDFVPAYAGANAAHIYGGNWATVTMWAEHHGIPYEGVSPSTVKKAIAGHGHAKKPAIMAAVRAMGFNPATADEADALAVLHTPVAA